VWKVGHGNNKTRRSCPVKSSHLYLAPCSRSNLTSRFRRCPHTVFDVITRCIKPYHSSPSFTPLAALAHHCGSGCFGVPCCLFLQHGLLLFTLVSMVCTPSTCLSSRANHFPFPQLCSVRRGTRFHFITLLQWAPLFLPYLRSSLFSLYSSALHS
jgi:hypothetical protein